ncbi:MAG: helix-turn-helix domain-containing protein [Hyphomonadaceae bacterium]|nr:helix-turn-helix domain-containing protein [Hyphomonadaceae bacterium]
MAQMKHKDARVLQFYRHLRSAIDVLELIALDPYQPPEKPAPEPVATPAPLPPPLVISQEKLTYSVKEASAALSLGKTTIWKAIADGVLPAQKFGNRTLIPAEGLRAWLASMPSAQKPRPGRR